VVIKVYDVRGKEVTALADGVFPAGSHDLLFDASGLATGIYFCRIQMGEYLAVRKRVLTK
jgi:hypothetical protein